MVNKVYFSPTRTGEKVIRAVADAVISEKSREYDLTCRALEMDFKSDELVLAAVPVYSGRIPDTALERLAKIKGNGTPAAVIALYGNRDFDDALLELSDFMTERGFSVIAAAAFIGEHSFSNRTNPIAVNRPDRTDMNKAEEFGRELTSEWDKWKENPETRVLRIPGNRPYKEKSAGKPFSPEADPDKCTGCGDCIPVCPVQAVDGENPLNTDEKLCIHCAACVKICSFEARSFPDIIVEPIRKRLFANCSVRKEPQLFLP